MSIISHKKTAFIRLFFHYLRFNQRSCKILGFKGLKVVDVRVFSVQLHLAVIACVDRLCQRVDPFLVLRCADFKLRELFDQLVQQRVKAKQAFSRSASDPPSALHPRPQRFCFELYS